MNKANGHHRRQKNHPFEGRRCDCRIRQHLALRKKRGQGPGGNCGLLCRHGRHLRHYQEIKKFRDSLASIKANRIQTTGPDCQAQFKVVGVKNKVVTVLFAP